MLLVHANLTRSQVDDFEDYADTYGFGPHTFRLRGKDYTGTLLNAPEEIDQQGTLYMVAATFRATRT